MEIRDVLANVTHSCKFHILENSEWGRKDPVPVSLEKAGSQGRGQRILTTRITPWKTPRSGRSPCRTACPWPEAQGLMFQESGTSAWPWPPQSVSAARGMGNQEGLGTPTCTSQSCKPRAPRDSSSLSFLICPLIKPPLRSCQALFSVSHCIVCIKS